MTQPVEPLAIYRRRIDASLERVWENVYDWEHLPWLHRSSFLDITHEDSGPWGWRARVGLPPADARNEILIELRTEREAGRYVTRTLAGPGAGTEIWTQLTPAAEHRTDIEVSFYVPGVPEDELEITGGVFVALYTRLWDEDQAMMKRREEMLSGAARSVPQEPALSLGPLAELRPRLPLQVAWAGRSWRIVELDGDLLAHSTVCPHSLGPLDEAALENGTIRCPWHGYRFDLRTGAGCGDNPLRLDRPPSVEVDDASQEVRLVPRNAAR